MQMTGPFVVEVLITGAMALIWIVLLVIRLVEPNTEQIRNALQYINTSVTLVLSLSAGISYVLGWIVSFVAESILNPFFQTKYRDKYFTSVQHTFYEVRSRVFEKSPEGVIKDIQYDRMLIRIARSNAFNLCMIALATIMFATDSTISKGVIYSLAILSFLLAYISFVQWQHRYKATFSKFMDLYKEICGLEMKGALSKDVGLGQPTASKAAQHTSGATANTQAIEARLKGEAPEQFPQCKPISHPSEGTCAPDTPRKSRKDACSVEPPATKPIKQTGKDMEA